MSVLLVFAFLLAAFQEEATPTMAPTLQPVDTPVPDPTEPPPPTEEVAVIQPIEVVDASQMEALLDELWVLVAYGDALNPDVIEAGAVITAVFGEDGTVSARVRVTTLSPLQHG